MNITDLEHNKNDFQEQKYVANACIFVPFLENKTPYPIYDDEKILPQGKLFSAYKSVKKM